MNMQISKQTQFHIKAALLIAALGIVVGQSWHELASLWAVLLAIGLTVLGYWFGKITCAEHDHPGRGLWLTLVLFVVLNATHSLLDGISLATSGASWFSVLAHEIVRQLALYGVVLGMIAPFTMKKFARFASSFITVTIIWALGMLAGEWAAFGLAHIAWLHPYLAAAAFLLVGDITHHLLDEYRKLAKTKVL